jgi:hypothetical protein
VGHSDPGPVYQRKALLVRMPVPLHGQIAEFAHHARVSMNAVCVAFLEEGMEKMFEATNQPEENTQP